MKRSFYHYVLTLKGATKPTDESTFAENVSNDITFPKQADNYDVVSEYLEMSTDYLSNMDIFDTIWLKYLEHNKGT